MSGDDDTPHRLVGRAGIVFAYVCFAISIATIGGAIYLLPIALKVKVFLLLATAFLISLFVFMAIATHIAMRGQGREARRKRNAGRIDDRDKTGPKGA